MDDEIQIRRLLRIGLQAQGFGVVEAATTREGISRYADSNPDLVILDLGLPDRDGTDLISEVRVWNKVPILVLSVRSSAEDKVEALDLGGSDYVSKPFSMAETARSRAGPAAGSAARERRRCRVPDRGVRTRRRAPLRVTVGGRVLRLSRKEFELLHLLARHAGRVVTHLLREIWGRVHESDTQYLRVYVSQLREKLDDGPARPRFIANEPGIGYRFIEPD